MFSQYSDIVTVKELCQMLKIGKNTAYTLLSSGSIRSIRIGRRFLIPKNDVITYLTVQRDVHGLEKEV